MRLNIARNSALSLWQPVREATEAHRVSRAEMGRRGILAGWVMTMIGIVCYIVAMSRAGESAEILDALTGQGMLGWLAGTFMLGGVVMWFIGNLACLRSLSDIPGEGGE